MECGTYVYTDMYRFLMTYNLRNTELTSSCCGMEPEEQEITRKCKFIQLVFKCKSQQNTCKE